MLKAYSITETDPKSAFARAKRHESARHNDEPIKVRLRAALVREGTLHRQLDALNQHNEILSKLLGDGKVAADRIADLTPREYEIMRRVVAGDLNKNIAADMGISQRTVENHRASIMKKTASGSLPELARLALAIAWNGVAEPEAMPAPVATATHAGEGRSAGNCHDGRCPADRPADAGTWSKEAGTK
jgi:DNA-binding CsgD family transcriptional regulator